MRANSLEILAITALFVNYVVGDAKSQTTTETPIENSIPDLKAVSGSKPSSSSANTTTKKQMDYWMRRMGSMDDNLVNIQAVIVKDEETNGTCKPAPRKSDKRYLMCVGSILNRNHVLTSAICVHDATHIRHNVRAPLAVVIAPLKPSMQVIPVTEYIIHPNHRTNPYTKDHLTHNVAIIKLSCRIDMENYHKIDLPLAPLRHTCGDENCIVAVFRRTGRTNHAMFQMLAPYLPYSTRRRKETSVQDVEIRRFKEYGRSEIIDGSIRLERPKRKLAEPPSFVTRYESRKILDDDLTNSTTELSTENSIVEETTTISIEEENMNTTIETSLLEDVSKALSEPEVADEPVKSFVVRSSEGYLACAHTGSPVMLKRTQAALVAIPCNGRQPFSKWYYTDLFDNIDWIHLVLQDRDPSPPGADLPRPTSPGSPSGNNGSGCSTCIFNFFIEIGCKEKGQCGKNVTNLPGQGLAKLPGQGLPNLPGQGLPNLPVQGLPNLPGQGPPDLPGPNPPADRPPMVSGRRKSQGCSNRNSVGIDVIEGQGCEKTDKESNIRPVYRMKSAKPISGAGKLKHLSQPNGAVDVGLQLQQPVTGHPVKTSGRNYIINKAKYPGNDNTRTSAILQNYKKPISRNLHRERDTNEIGLHNTEGDSSDWLSEVEKGLNSQVKRELVKSRPSNTK